MVAIHVSSSNVPTPMTLRGHHLDTRDEEVLNYIGDMAEPPHVSTHYHMTRPTCLQKLYYRNRHTWLTDYVDVMHCKHGFRAGKEDKVIPQMVHAVGAYSHDAHEGLLRSTRGIGGGHENGGKEAALDKCPYLYQPCDAMYGVEPLEQSLPIILMAKRRKYRACKYDTTGYSTTDAMQVAVVLGTEEPATMMQVVTALQQRYRLTVSQCMAVAFSATLVHTPCDVHNTAA